MNLERLEMLIDVLRRVELNDLPFDMTTWIERHTPCQTTACALGYAALDPRFQAMGLRMVSRKGDPIDSVEQYNDMAKEAWTVHGQTINVDVIYEDHEAYRAGALLFDISLHASAALFDPEMYHRGDIEPHEVISRIRAVILNDGDWPAEDDENDDDDLGDDPLGDHHGRNE